MSERQAYFVKLRGRTLGPIEEPRLRQMIRAGEISRACPISSDGQNWQTAADFRDLYQLQEPPNLLGQSSAEGQQAPVPRVQNSVQNAATALVNKVNPLPPIQAPSWYYGGAQKPIGPVSSDIIDDLIQDGRLTAQHLVWRTGLNEWTPLSAVREFSDALMRQSVPRQPSRFCFACGVGIDQRAEICPKCGVRQPFDGTTPSPVSGWGAGEFALLIVLTILIPLIGIIAGFVGLGSKGKEGQGVVLLIVAFAMIFAFLSII
jgi:hypothetical protein